MQTPVAPSVGTPASCRRARLVSRRGRSSRGGRWPWPGGTPWRWSGRGRPRAPSTSDPSTAGRPREWDGVGAVSSVGADDGVGAGSFPRAWDGDTAATTKPVAREAMASMLRFFMTGSTVGHGQGSRIPGVLDRSRLEEDGPAGPTATSMSTPG